MRPEPSARTLPRALALAALMLPGVVTLAAEPTAQQRVEARLMCYCGCTDLTVRVCTCGTAEAIRKDIRSRLAGGRTEDEIVAAYIADHGEQIRSAPGTSGFDLVAWITPFVALLLAGSALVVVVRRWKARGAPEIPPLPAGAGPGQAVADSRALERVRRELRERR